MTDLFTRTARAALGLASPVKVLAGSRYAPGADQPESELLVPDRRAVRAQVPRSLSDRLLRPAQGAEGPERQVSTAISPMAEPMVNVPPVLVATPPAVVAEGTWASIVPSEGEPHLPDAYRDVKDWSPLPAAPPDVQTVEKVPFVVTELAEGVRARRAAEPKTLRHVDSGERAVEAIVDGGAASTPVAGAHGIAVTGARAAEQASPPVDQDGETTFSWQAPRKPVEREAPPAARMPIAADVHPAVFRVEPVPMEPAAEDTEPVIRVTIGRVEVRTPPPAAPPPVRPTPPAPHLSLDEYLRSRQGGRR